jgi:hypothetical protein
MRQRFLIATTLFVLAAYTSAGEGRAQAASNENLSLQDQLERNWSIPTPLECRRVVSMRILIAPDGRVTGTDSVDAMSAEDPCQVVITTLRRAALLSSPLWFPPGQTPESAVVHFDPEHFKDFY